MRRLGRSKRLLVLATLVLVAGSCGGDSDSSPPPPTSGPPPPPPPPPPSPELPPPTVIAEPLATLVADDEAAYNALYPLQAQLRGDAQYRAEFGDYLSDAWYAAVRQRSEDNIDALSMLDRATLGTVEKVVYDTFAFNEQATLDLFDPQFLAIERALPMNHITGIHSFYPYYASGGGPLPFATLQDYEDNIPRTREFAAAIDATRDAFERGAQAGLFESQNTIDIVVAQLNSLLSTAITASQFYRPVTIFPSSISTTDRNRLTNDYTAMVRDDVYPALTRLRDYLRDTYRPMARATPGLVGMPGGQAYYAHLIKRYTTLDLSADEIHQLGLDETQRILARMEQLRVNANFSGTLQQYNDSLFGRADLVVSTRQQLIDFYEDLGRQVDGRLQQHFSRTPVTPLEIQPYDAYREQFFGGASYQPGAFDATRPGIFFFNGRNVGFAPIEGMSLYLHEAAPGHHFQISIAQEDAGLPHFMRFGGNRAFVEGWALYAETLGYDMNLYSDPAFEFGHLRLMLLRAHRLVVDSGIHDRGWSRSQAIGWITANSPFSQGQAAGAVDRYIGWPGQALAYMAGQLEIQAIRDDAEARLGNGFDPRNFHDQVLLTGALPMPVLRTKVDDWIVSGGG